MAENETRALVTKLYRAYADGDGQTVAAILHEDIDWHLYSPADVFPFAGPRRGKAAVLEVLGAIGAEYVVERYEPKIVVVDGDRAAVLSQVAMVQRATEQPLSFWIANFLRFEGGKLIELRELSDNFDVATAKRLAMPT